MWSWRDGIKTCALIFISCEQTAQCVYTSVLIGKMWTMISILKTAVKIKWDHYREHVWSSVSHILNVLNVFTCMVKKSPVLPKYFPEKILSFWKPFDRLVNSKKALTFCGPSDRKLNHFGKRLMWNKCRREIYFHKQTLFWKECGRNLLNPFLPASNTGLQRGSYGRGFVVESRGKMKMAQLVL